MARSQKFYFIAPMIQEIDELCVQADGRFATDAELMFFQKYLKTARLRFALYQKIQQLEPQIIKSVLAELQEKEPQVLKINGADLTAKWQRDTVRLLRYAATALLTDDAALFEDKMLHWFQSIMKSFRAESNCEATYRVMQSVLQEKLTPTEAALFCPLIKLSQVSLSST